MEAWIISKTVPDGSIYQVQYNILLNLVFNN